MSEVLYDGGWVKLIKTDRGFIFAQRRGKDSTALLLWRERKDRKIEVLVRNQPLPIDNSDYQKLFPCPIIGGLTEGQTPEINAAEEALEEGGYKISYVDLDSLGSYIVGTQTDEVVYMFGCDVTLEEPEVPTTDGSYFESISKNEWRLLDSLMCERYSGLFIIAHQLKDQLGV